MQYMCVVVWDLVSTGYVCGMISTGVSCVDMTSCVYTCCGCVQCIHSVSTVYWGMYCVELCALRCVFVLFLGSVYVSCAGTVFRMYYGPLCVWCQCVYYMGNKH